MRCSTKIVLLALLSGAIVVPADARRPRYPTFEWGLDGSVGTTYNSNILGISSRDRSRFLSDPTSFQTPLESVDDLETELALRPQLRWRVPMTLMVDVDYRFKYVSRARNSFTDYHTHSVNLSVRRRVVGYNWQTRFRVLAVPSYYLRVYRDRDYREWRSAKYSNFDYELFGRYRWWRSLWSELGAGYGTFYYNPSFTEYDSEYQYGSFGSGYDFSAYWTVEASYTRRLNFNTGKNQPGVFTTPPEDPQLIGDTEYGDSDYNEDDWSARIASRTLRKASIPVEVSVSYRLRRRVYTTDRALDQDPFHRGRLDRRHQVTFALQIEAIPRMSFDPYFAYDERRTDSQVPLVPLVKNFVRREYGFGISYRIR